MFAGCLEIDGLKRRIADLGPALRREQLVVVPFYDRSQLIRETTETLSSTLVEAVPSELTVVADRFDRLATGRKLPSGVSRDDVLGARGRLRDALALWDRARQEAEAGRLPEAVTLAHQVRGLGRSVDVVSPPAAAPVE